MYLDQRLETVLFDRKGSASGGGWVSSYGEIDRYGGRGDFRSPPPRAYEYIDGGGAPGMTRRSRSFGDVTEAAGGRDGRDKPGAAATTPIQDMTPERLFGKMSHLQRLLDRFLSCRPTGLAKTGFEEAGRRWWRWRQGESEGEGRRRGVVLGGE
ncbi:unnamed protein product [Linum trigynum]|uniref:Uncharacterized protein n=1 Tax=Linum trigynum TaxID=586398 RepID=A0AAV2GWR0_9ROSI